MVGEHYLTNELAQAKAEELNLEVVVPDDYTLTIDIDDNTVPVKTLEMIEKINQHYPIRKQGTTYSKSGNLHVYLKLETGMTVMEKIALQAILGSDPIKELLSFVRAKRGGLGDPTLMFETKTGVTALEELFAGE